MYKYLKYSAALIAVFTVTIFGSASPVQPDYDVDVEVAYGLNHMPALKKAIEQNTSSLLREFNVASHDDRGLNYSNIKINVEAKTVLNNLWKGQRMKYASFDEGFNTPVSEKVTQNKYGEYEIRNIPVFFLDAEHPEDEHYEELGITFDSKGTIIDIYVTIERNQFQKMMRSMSEVKDENQRLAILYMMESMATAYHQKDLNWFKTFLSDDVLVVTGSKKLTPTGETFSYKNYDKEGYLSSLKNVFTRNPVIQVKFSDITVYGHPLDESGRYYAVECEQSWFSTNYSDVGNLFVIWDFGRKDQPLILFRGWTEKSDPTQFNIIDAVKLEL